MSPYLDFADFEIDILIHPRVIHFHEVQLAALLLDLLLSLEILVPIVFQLICLILDQRSQFLQFVLGLAISLLGDQECLLLLDELFLAACSSSIIMPVNRNTLSGVCKTVSNFSHGFSHIWPKAKSHR